MVTCGYALVVAVVLSFSLEHSSYEPASSDRLKEDLARTSQLGYGFKRQLSLKRLNWN